MALTQPLTSEFARTDEALVAPVKAPLLAHLRLAGLMCRTAVRSELFHACALLQVDRVEHAGAFAAALVRGLPEALGKRPIFLAPGEAEQSFDESWVMSAAAAHRANDSASFDFLIRSRVAPAARRHVGFLVAGLAEATSG